MPCQPHNSFPLWYIFIFHFVSRCFEPNQGNDAIYKFPMNSHRAVRERGATIDSSSNWWPAIIFNVSAKWSKTGRTGERENIFHIVKFPMKFCFEDLWFKLTVSSSCRLVRSLPLSNSILFHLIITVDDIVKKLKISIRMCYFVRWLIENIWCSKFGIPYKRFK